MVRIPAGATSIYVQQKSNSGKLEDDNYLGERGTPGISSNSCFLEQLVDTPLPAQHMERFQVACIFTKEVGLEIHLFYFSHIYRLSGYYISHY